MRFTRPSGSQRSAARRAGQSTAIATTSATNGRRNSARKSVELIAPLSLPARPAGDGNPYTFAERQP